MTDNRDILGVTAFFSALTHAVIILGISFKLPDLAAQSNTDNTLDVVLLTTNNNEKSDNADNISSTDNAGGGHDDKEAESPLPYKAIAPSPIQTVKKTANQQAANTLSPDQFITAIEGELALKRLSPEEIKFKTKEKLVGPDKITTKSQIQLEKERLAAKLAKSFEDYQKRPNKVFLSPSTKAHGAAEYLSDWKQRVVTVGNANYPTRAKARKLTGTLILTVEINRNGTLNALHIENPSEHKLLNDAAMRFVRNASPFKTFPDSDYFKTIDILVITRAFHFLPGNRLTSSDASGV